MSLFEHVCSIVKGSELVSIVVFGSRKQQGESIMRDLVEKLEQNGFRTSINHYDSAEFTLYVNPDGTLSQQRKPYQLGSINVWRGKAPEAHLIIEGSSRHLPPGLAEEYKSVTLVSTATWPGGKYRQVRYSSDLSAVQVIAGLLAEYDEDVAVSAEDEQVRAYIGAVNGGAIEIDGVVSKFKGRVKLI